MSKVLIIDDNAGVREALELLLDLAGIQCTAVESPSEGLERARRGDIDLVIADMNFTADTTSGEEGLALFADLRTIDEDLPIILLTAWTHLDQAVELVKGGAADYLPKPWDDDKLLTAVGNLLALRSATASNRQHREKLEADRADLRRRFDLLGVTYASRAMHDCLSIATRVARSDVPVMITGPNGSGKGRVAEIIQANSRVADGPFVTVNAGALPANLIEAELFGAEAGAYTGAGKSRAGRFESADGGTLFLDEIGNLPLDGQMKLLRVLQTGEFERIGSNRTRRVNVRLITATNTDLDIAVREGRFREDLLYRINVIQVELPSLKSRPADILPLARHFLKKDHRLSPAAERALTAHDWPGNVRELENRIHRAALLADNPAIEPADLDLTVSTSSIQEPDEGEIRQALTAANGVVARAARSLNLSRQALYRRMEKFGLN